MSNVMFTEDLAVAVAVWGSWVENYRQGGSGLSHVLFYEEFALSEGVRGSWVENHRQVGSGLSHVLFYEQFALSEDVLGSWVDTHRQGGSGLPHVLFYAQFALSVAAPACVLANHLHPDAAVAALYAGKHVTLEKPIAVTTAECDSITA